MKPMFATLPLLFLAACATQPATPPEPIGMPNPASVHCVREGGTVEIRRTDAGEAGYCRLPDGRVVEEWEFFRASQGSEPSQGR